MIVALILLTCADMPCPLAAWAGPGAMPACRAVLATMPRGVAVCVEMGDA